MPGFSDSFWTNDYSSGVNVLAEKLQQGVVENQQLLTIARLRADAEQAYSDKLGNILPAVDKLAPAGFAHDDGATTRKAFEGVRTEMVEAMKNHSKIAVSIRDLVVAPFSSWADKHKTRVTNTKEEVDAKIKDHAKQAELVGKLRTAYFNKGRLLEDFEEENKFAFQAQDAVQQSPTPKTPSIVLPEIEEEELEPVEIGDMYYPPEKLKELLAHIINTLNLSEFKVAILGTYENTATGADFVEYFQKYMDASTISLAERIGQDLVDLGFLRLVGNVGSIFANSSKLHYQLRPRCFKLAGIPQPKKNLIRIGSLGTNSDDGGESPVNAVSELISGWNPLNSNGRPNETPLDRLKREAAEADNRYRSAVRKLDLMRCNLEETMIDYFDFMERCELDRLKAIKAVILDFSGGIGNVVPTLRATVDQMMAFQEAINPNNDLNYLVDSYKTGIFIPHVTPYESYNGLVDSQTFGVDLEARARADKKRVPVIVTNILTFLDNHYPDLEGDETRRAIWLHRVPLASVHHLRNTINNGQPVPDEVLEKYEVPVVASVLKLFLLELPESIVSSQFYEIVHNVYTSNQHSADLARIKILQGTLGGLRLNNIATLDAIMTHFSRLIDLTSADDKYVTDLSKTLSPCILRARRQHTFAFDDTWIADFVRDLLLHKEDIFGRLKRQTNSNYGTLGPAPAGARNRTVSDESNRRAYMEARNRAILENARATSPVPPHARHRQDRSRSSQEMGRFPIHVEGSSPSGYSSPTQSSRHYRSSLDVPRNSPSPSPTAASAGAVFPAVGVSNVNSSDSPTAAGKGIAGNAAPATDASSPVSEYAAAAAPAAAHVHKGGFGGDGAGAGAGSGASEQPLEEPVGVVEPHAAAAAAASAEFQHQQHGVAAESTDSFSSAQQQQYATAGGGGGGRTGSPVSSDAGSQSRKESLAEKRASLNRSPHVSRVSSLRAKFATQDGGAVSEKADSRSSTPPPSQQQQPQPQPQPHQGVTLVDTPMDDYE